MPRRAITEEMWALLLDTYRAAPGQHVAAGKATGLDRRTAAKAWNKGLPQFDGGKPISETIEEERRAARARLQEEAEVARRAAEAEREKARAQAIQARKVEGQVVALARTNSLNALAASAEMLSVARGLAQRVKAKVQKLVSDEEAVEKGEAPDLCEHCGRGPEKNPPGVLISLIDRITAVSRRVNEQAEEAMRMERLHLGDPTQIIGITDDHKTIPMDEAKDRLAVARQAVERALAKAGVARPGGEPN